MVFFELQNIETMLNETHDPIADFINAVSADVIDMASQLTFDQFKEQTQRLGDLITYRQLTQRADRIGYTISKVVYRGTPVMKRFARCAPRPMPGFLPERQSMTWPRSANWNTISNRPGSSVRSADCKLI
jgi:hypothetical protein